MTKEMERILSFIRSYGYTTDEIKDIVITRAKELGENLDTVEKALNEFAQIDDKSILNSENELKRLSKGYNKRIRKKIIKILLVVFVLGIAVDAIILFVIF